MASLRELFAFAIGTVIAGACSSFTPGEQSSPADAGSNEGGGPDASSDVNVAADVEPKPSAYRTAILADAPLAYWRMGIKTGSSIPDESGNGHTLVLQGGGHVLSEPGAIAGDDDTAIRFDGVASFAAVGESRPFDLAGGAFAIECWARRDGTDGVDGGGSGGGSSHHVLVANIDGELSDRNGYLLFAQAEPASTTFRYATPGGADVSAFGRLVPAGAWTHYVVVYKEPNVSLYIDGTLEDSAVSAARVTARESPFELGREVGYGGYWLGAIDEVALFDHELTLPQIAIHYDLGRKK